MLQPRRNDAKAWKIDQRGAPSPRGYLAVVGKWSKAQSDWNMRVFQEARVAWERKRGRRDAVVNEEGDVLNDADAADFAGYLLSEYQKKAETMPETPKPETIKQVGEPIARIGVRTATTDLKKAGMPDDVLLNIVSPRTEEEKKKAITAIDLFDSGLGVQELNDWAVEGTSLIVKLSQDQLPALQKNVIATARGGFRWETMVKTIQDSGDTTEAHARLIAQDQVAKLNGKISQSLNEKAGIKEFIWRASSDSRTRERHRAVNGKKFSMATGAPNVGFYGETGFPGQCGRCRCTMQPVPPDWW